MEEKIEAGPEEIIEEEPKTGFLNKIKIHKFKILGGILGIFVFAGAVFGAYRLGQIQREKEESRSKAEQIELSRCDKDDDCIVAIRLDSCCPCPKAVSREALKKDKNLVEYEFGKRYPPFPSAEECSKRVVCSPCADWNKAICEAGKCKGVFEPAHANWRIYTNKEYNYSIKYPDEWQYAESNKIVAFKSEAFAARITIAIKENPSKLAISDWLTQQEENENWKLDSEDVWVSNVHGIKWSTEPIEIETGEKFNQVDVYLAKNSLVYDLRYSVPKSAKSQLNTFNLMLSTFRFFGDINPQSDCLESCKCMKECNKEGPVYFIHNEEGAFECSANSVNKTCCCSGV